MLLFMYLNVIPIVYTIEDLKPHLYFNFVKMKRNIKVCHLDNILQQNFYNHLYYVSYFYIWRKYKIYFRVRFKSSNCK